MDNSTLWILQGILAFVFLFSGFMKSTRSKEQLVRSGQTAIEDFELGTIRMIGISEVLGAIALILPWSANIWPILTPISAALLGAIMVLAAIAHFRRGEMKVLPINLVFFIICMMVAYYRFQTLKENWEAQAHLLDWHALGLLV